MYALTSESEYEVRQLPPTEKQPAERVIPTLDVVVALPLIVSPVTVVVPKPVPDTDKNLVAFDELAISNTGFV